MHETNPDRMDALLPHEALEQGLLDAARPDKVAKQHGRGRLTVRERIDLLADEGTFQEIGAHLSGWARSVGRRGSASTHAALTSGASGPGGVPWRHD